MLSFDQLAVFLTSIKEDIIKHVHDSGVSIRAEFTQKFESLDKKIELMDKKIESLNSKIGSTFEVCSRQEIRIRHGHRYADCFFSKDLFGLVRIALPKCPAPFEQKELYQDITFIQQRRVNAIGKFIYADKKLKENTMKIAQEEITRIDNLPTKRKSDLELLKLCESVKYEILDWERYEGQKRGASSNLEYLSHRPELSIFLLSTAVLTKEFRAERNIFEMFKRNLEIDVRGRAEVLDGVILIEMGEIKSTTANGEISHAVEQLAIRLSFVAWVVSAVLQHYDCVDKYSLMLTGRVFIPIWKVSSKPDPNKLLERKPGLPSQPAITWSFQLEEL